MHWKKWEDSMKLLSIFMVFHGLVYSVSAINNLTKQNMFKYGSQYYNANLHLIGIFIGILLIISGIGIWINKRKAYYVALILYGFLFFYGIISVAYLGFLGGFELGWVLSSFAVVTLFYFLSRYIFKKIIS